MNEIKHYAILYEWADWVDSQDVMQKFHISVRTLQNWRTNGLFALFTPQRKNLLSEIRHPCRLAEELHREEKIIIRRPQ